MGGPNFYTLFVRMKKFYFIQAPDSLVAGDFNGNTVNHPFVLRFFSFQKEEKADTGRGAATPGRGTKKFGTCPAADYSEGPSWKVLPHRASLRARGAREKTRRFV